MFKLALVVLLALAFASPTRAQADICRYYLYTRAGGLVGVEIFANDLNNVNIPEINTDATTVLLVHGQGGSAFSSLNPYILSVMLNAEDVNVIVVDWSTLASGSYSAAVISVPFVATSLNNFINQLTLRTTPVDLNLLHIVGFDLGAHVAGIAARSLNKVARITGLDPSGSQWGANSARLTRTDAQYVEVIHTDGSGILANGIGTAIGTVDFFANGGGNQPGCLTHSCHHNRAYELFAASFVNPGLIGYLCTSNLQLSLNLCRGALLRIGTNELTKTGFGTYRVNTASSYPF